MCVCFFYSFDFLKTFILMDITAHPKIFKRNLKWTKKNVYDVGKEKKKSTGIREVDLFNFDLPFARV